MSSPLEKFSELMAKATEGEWRALTKSQGMTGVHADDVVIYHARFDPECLPETHERQVADARAVVALHNVWPRVEAFVKASEAYWDCPAEVTYVPFADARDALMQAMEEVTRED